MHRLLTKIIKKKTLFPIRFTEDVYQMTGYRPGIYWQWTWRYIGPVIMFLILISSVVCMIIDKPSYNAYSKETVSPRLRFVKSNIYVYHIRDLINIVFVLQSGTVVKEYPGWVLAIGVSMITAGVLPMPIVFLLRRFQILKVDLDIHQGSIRRNETTASTKQMMDEDDVSTDQFRHIFCKNRKNKRKHKRWMSALSVGCAYSLS